MGAALSALAFSAVPAPAASPPPVVDGSATFVSPSPKGNVRTIQGGRPAVLRRRLSVDEEGVSLDEDSVPESPEASPTGHHSSSGPPREGMEAVPPLRSSLSDANLLMDLNKSSLSSTLTTTAASQQV